MQNGTTETRPRRHAAGQDPAKRQQILAGAQRVFSRLGFDAASMNDITREAAVSKGTIYVYFENKEQLFIALVDEERERIFRSIELALEGPGSLAGKLKTFAATLACQICSNEVIRALRVVIGVSERMPELGARFYERGAQRGKAILQRFLESEARKGTVEIDDFDMAAYQFIDLATAGLFRRRLFAHMAEPPSEDQIERTSEAAVRTFVAAYGTGRDRS